VDTEIAADTTLSNFDAEKSMKMQFLDKVSDSHKVQFSQLPDQVEARLLVVSRLFSELHDTNPFISPSSDNLERGVDHWGQSGGLYRTG